MSNTNGITRVLIAGGGTMGQEIAVLCAARGFSVRVFDVDPQALQKGARAKSLISSIEDHDSAWVAERSNWLQKLRVETRLDAAAEDADLVIECLPERLKLKCEFFVQVSQLVSPTAILATNSSMLVPSQLRAGVQYPERLAALHFINETHAAEVMGHDGTNPEILRRLESFLKELRVLPILCKKEKTGCVLNSMLTSLNFTALTLAAQGYASVEDIDRLWMLTMRCPRGPFGMLDIIGLDTAYDITWLQALMTGDEQSRGAAEFLKSYVKQGRLGVKSGHGFYTYPHPAYQQPGFHEAPYLPEPIAETLLPAAVR